jgi:hypothetical protein
MTLSVGIPHSEHHSLLAFSIKGGNEEHKSIDRAMLQDIASGNGTELSIGVTAQRIMLIFSLSNTGIAHTVTGAPYPLRYKLHSHSDPEHALEIISSNINEPAVSEQDFRKFWESLACSMPVSCTKESLAAMRCRVIEDDIKNRASSTSSNCDTSDEWQQNIDAD